MTQRRSYNDLCSVARALDVVGERWALLVVRELLLGPKRFTDLHRGLGGASQNVLSQRLRDLERDGIVVRRTLGPPTGARVYELTAWGRELDGVVEELSRWGARAPAPPGAAISVDALVVTLRTGFDAGAAGTLDVVCDLRLGDDRLTLRVQDGHLEVERGTPDAPDAVLETDVATLLVLAFAGHELDDAIQAGTAHVAGDRAAAARLLGAFAHEAAASPVRADADRRAGADRTGT